MGVGGDRLCGAGVSGGSARYLKDSKRRGNRGPGGKLIVRGLCVTNTMFFYIFASSKGFTNNIDRYDD